MADNKDDFSSIEFKEDLYGKIRGQLFTKSHSFYPSDYNDITAMNISDTMSLYQGISNQAKETQDYYNRIEEYEDMNKGLPELDAIYTIYTDEATVENLFNNKVIWTESKNEQLAKESQDLLEFLEIPYHISMIAYNLVSKGNAFMETVISKRGVSKIVIHKTGTIKRIELPDHTLLGFAMVGDIRSTIDYPTFLKGLTYKKEYIKEYGSIDKGKIKSRLGFYPFHPFEMVHFRLRKHSSIELYGYSVMDALRGHWESNVMTRAALVTERITRSTVRRKIMLNVGKTNNIKDIRKKMNDMAVLFKRKSVFKNNGISLQYNPFSEQEDLIIPMQDNIPMFEIDEIPGRDISPKIEDIEYSDKKITTVSLIPKSVLNGENEGRATIAQENVRFAKRIYAVQSEITRGFRKVIETHLIINDETKQGLLDSKLVVKMNYTSDTAKLIQIETMNQVVGYFQSLEDIFPDKERYYQAFGLSNEKIDSMLVEIRKNKIRRAIDEAAAILEADKYTTKNTPEEKESKSNDKW